MDSQAQVQESEIQTQVGRIRDTGGEKTAYNEINLSLKIPRLGQLSCHQ